MSKQKLRQNNHFRFLYLGIGKISGSPLLTVSKTDFSMNDSEHSEFVDELASHIESPVLPILPFSSDDLRSLHVYSSSRPSRSRSYPLPEHSRGTNAPLRERQTSLSNIETKNSNSKLNSMEECISRLRALAGKIQCFAKCSIIRRRC